MHVGQTITDTATLSGGAFPSDGTVTFKLYGPFATAPTANSCVDSGAFNSNVITYSESHNLGWAAFAWNAAGPSGWSLLQSWSTYAPSTQGQPVRDALWKAKGWTSPGGV